MSMVPSDLIVRYAGELLYHSCFVDDPDAPPGEPFARWLRLLYGGATPDDYRQTWIEWFECHNPIQGDSFDA
jgi:hypothetical protein